MIAVSGAAHLLWFVPPVYWPKKSRVEIRAEVQGALARNIHYGTGRVLGLPGSFLDRQVFPEIPFLEQAPFLRCLRENPNHIGCHTLTASERVFAGTQAIEQDLLRICAEEILRARPGEYDGYVASGGTECNITALWAERNRLRDEHGAAAREIVVLYSVDTHYSIPKAIDLLGVAAAAIPVDERTRKMVPGALGSAVREARGRGGRHFIVVLNMGTTLFGSVDDIDEATRELDGEGADYRVHVDAAFGGFIYPFTNPKNPLDFSHPRVASITLDGHKMLQAPYGTGIFLSRKGLIARVGTREAEYVPGGDHTLCGSRSGANAVAVWMILHSYGSEEGRAFLDELVARTDRLARALDTIGVRYFREPRMNLVAIRAEDIPSAVAERNVLVPDRHDGPPRHWKIVVMDHVTDTSITDFTRELREARAARGGSAGPTPIELP